MVTKRQADKAREAIHAGQIIARLQAYLLGKPAKEKCVECGTEYDVFNISDETLKKLEPSQVRAGLGLLNHVLPAVQEIRQEDTGKELTIAEQVDRLEPILKERMIQEEMNKRGITIQYRAKLEAVQ